MRGLQGPRVCSPIMGHARPLNKRTRNALALLALALIQACATQPPPSSEPQPAPQAPQPRPAQPAPAAAAPARQQPPAPPKPLDAANLPPFDGDRETLVEPLRGVKRIDRTAPVKDIWQRIRQGFAMPELHNELVRKHMGYYAARPDYLQRMFERSRIYLYHIVEELEKRHMPTELALLPMVESAFNPLAYSRAHASGLWQFVPGTGRRFELKQDWWYDGRRDIVDSTNAALDYLAYLYEMHGDWFLALASYNWGENAVARAISRNRKARKPTDYSSLRMPRETREYVPKLQALKNIIANPAQYGIELEPIPNEPYFAVVDEPPDIDVALAAKLADMPVEEFIALNPGFSRPLIRSKVTARIVLPADKVDVFHDNLAKYGRDSLVSWQVYRPKRGQRLGAIAKKFGVSIAELKRVNGIARHSWRVPSVLVVPMNGAAQESIRTLPIMYAPPVAVHRGVRRIHIVKRGDTVSGIAARYRVRVADLKRWNRLGKLLQIGQRIYIR
ncbi:MAG: LysM peptidoglycan-binding domain-containing protein [Betaproteobacteria bacterium]|nr:MAG: LysM peptidoglycan-binding domain-containing protein [Betaproteobacteria bacterium]